MVNPIPDGFYRSSMWVGAMVLLAVPFALVALPFVYDWSVAELAASLILTVVSIGSIEVCCHRYFSHRAFKTSRGIQFVMGLLSVLTFQRSALWWASTHRHHHATSDLEQDCHSPRHGFVQAYWRWLYRSACSEINWKLISDFRGYPELIVLDWLHPFVNGAYVFGIWYFLGLKALAIFFVIPIGLSSHVILGTNYFCHLDRFGYRSFSTNDGSRNSFIFGLLAAGQGWHNNHHKFPALARTSLKRYEFDWGYAIIRSLEYVGLVWDVRKPKPGLTTRRPSLEDEVRSW